MDLGLNDLIDGKRIVQIDADSIPAPPQSPHPGDHLIVNCHYNIEMAKPPSTDLYDAARSDGLEIVRRLAEKPAVRKFVSLVVRVIGHFPDPQMQRPARRRIYEVSVLSNNLPTGSRPISRADLKRMGAVEGSQIDDVAELLHQTTH